MNILIATAAILGVVALTAFAIAPKAEIRTEIAIDATPEQVWAVLADVEGHSNWNPFLVSMKGELVQGARLENRMRPGNGSGEMTFRPVVLKVEPNRELRWLGRFLMPRIFDGEHYFVLERNGGATRLVHGENFRGIALWFFDVEQFRPDFEAMNMALKGVVEAGTGAPATGIEG